MVILCTSVVPIVEGLNEEVFWGFYIRCSEGVGIVLFVEILFSAGIVADDVSERSKGGDRVPCARDLGSTSRRTSASRAPTCHQEHIANMRRRISVGS